MQLKDISQSEFIERLAGPGLRIRSGPYIYNLQTAEQKIIDGLTLLYQDFEIFPETEFADFHITMRPSGISQRLRKVVEFYWDGRCPMNIIEVRHTYAFLEWGMNWCVSIASNEYLKLHAAVLEKNGRALIMPGLPGAGKSTLCAALTLSGWRLLSDEHALVPLHSDTVVPLCRPISLKNESIDIIRDFDPSVTLSAIAEETHKGRVAHMKADMAAGSHDITPVPAGLMIFPEYGPEAEFGVRRKPKAEAFMFAGLHSFNYKLLGEVGFDTMSRLMHSSHCFDVRYSTLEQAIGAVEELEREVFPT